MKGLEISVHDAALILTSIVTVASIIVKATPTQNDDAFLSRYIMPIMHWFALTPNDKK